MDIRDTAYQPAIDGLRAIAVLAVIANHFHEPLLPHGYLGVDIFFVISGYVITKSLHGYSNPQLFGSIKQFYSRRINRLLPALLVCIACTSLFAVLFTPSPRTTLLTGASSLFGLSNLYLFKISTDYFSDSATLNFFTHTWSLGVEEQFYLLMPLLFFCLRFSRWSSEKLFPWLMVSASLGSLCGFLYLHDSSPGMAFFMMPFRFWELATGVLTFYLINRGNALLRFPRFLDLRVTLVLLLAILSMPLIPKSLATVLVVLLSALILAQLTRHSQGSTLLCLSPLALIGQMSYSLYLWHWSVLVLARWTVGVSVQTIPFLLVLIFVLSYLSFTQIEQRFRTTHTHAYFQRNMAVSLSACLAAFFAMTVTASQTVVDPYLGTRNTHLQKASAITSQDTAHKTREQMDAQLADIRYRCNMTPMFLGENAYSRDTDFNTAALDDCLGSTDKPKIVLMGDSFASVIAEHLMYIAEDLGHEFNMVYGFRCPYPLDKRNIQYATASPCKVDPQLLQTGLTDNLKPGDILVLRLFFQSKVYSQLPANRADEAVLAYDKELNTLIERANTAGAGVLLVGTNGAIPSDSPCNLEEWFNRFQCADSNRVDIQMPDLAHNLLAQSFNQHLVDRFHNEHGLTRVLNPLTALCGKDPDTCPLTRDGKAYMRDTYHLSQIAVDDFHDDMSAEIEGLSQALSFMVDPKKPQSAQHRLERHYGKS